MPSVTIGEGVKQPQGRALQLSQPYPEALFAALSAQPKGRERWQSPHRWRNDYRKTEHWEASIGAILDLDYRVSDEMPPAAMAETLLNAARAGAIPGTIFHLTPHGARAIFAYELELTHREMQIAATKGAAEIMTRALVALAVNYKVDPCSWDLGHLFYTHNAYAKGVQRNDELLFMRSAPYSADELAAEAPREPEAAPRASTKATRVLDMHDSIAERINEWVFDNSPEYPKRPKTCPICAHNDCFKVDPNDRRRWYCFSTGHTEGAGKKGNSGWHGDAMDIERHVTGRTVVEILRRDGYLSAPSPPPAAMSSDSTSEPTPIRTAEAPETEPAFRAWKNRSLLTCLGILRKNALDVLKGRKLELNELTGESELGRKAVEDTDITEIRGRIELLFPGGTDKNGNVQGMQQNKQDVCDAVDQVAREHAYNPLKQYLESLKWDGVERIGSVCEDILGAEVSQINQSIVRNFFVSAAARAMNPGCQVHTVMVLVGGQGAGKSTFFRVLGGDWFADSAVDIKDKDSFQNLRGSWIYEWAELEALNRARDSSAAKAFLSSAVDRYRPSYGRRVVNVPRSCVIVGSTNRNDFLEDETGNRRFWPLQVGELIDTDLLRGQRDQLWAEAVHLYRSGAKWHLDQEESTALAVQQKGFESIDAWGKSVLSLDFDSNDYDIADVLQIALKKEMNQWTRMDELRIGKILRQAGFERRKRHGGLRFWKRK